MAEGRWLIVWDLDRTLGAFESLSTIDSLTDPVRIWLRPAIGETLARLSEAAFEHTVLTVATPEYARMALRASGLWQLFAEVAGRGQRPKGDAQGIARRFGIPDDERPARMIFIGDHPLIDPPSDPRVVFHLELHALERSAVEVERLLLYLRERGGGSLRAGFDRLLAPAPSPGDGASAALKSVRREVPQVGRLLLFPQQDECPKIAFDDPVDRPAAPAPVSFRPADIG